MRWIVMLVALVSSSCFSDVPEYDFIRFEVGSHIDVRVNSISDISIPLSSLVDAKIAGIDGLVFIFKDKSAISIDSLSAKSLGYPEADMRSWPLFMLGEKPDSDLPSEFINDVEKSRQVLVNSNAPYKKGRFKTKNGHCYLLIGEERSTIYITDSNNKEIITSITTSGMSEEKIQKYLLQGVI